MTEKFLVRLAILVSAVSILAIALHLVSALATDGPWDDGLMFVRYANHVLSGSGISWNNAPTYGLTSQVMLLVTIPLAALIHNPLLVSALSSIIGMLCFLACTVVLVCAATPDTSRTLRTVIVALCLASFALAYHSFAPLVVSGMDTMLGDAYLALYLALALIVVRGTSRRRWILLGFFGGLAYLVRPDLLIFTAVIPFICALSLSESSERRRAWESIGIWVIVLVVELLIARAYYGTALPLPFYAKAGSLYGPVTALRFRFVPLLELIGFIDAYILLILAASVSIWILRRELFSRTKHAVWIGIVAAAVCSMLYFLFLVLQIMPYEGRFYYPMLPALIALSCALAMRFWVSPRIREIRNQVFTGVLLVVLAGLYTPLFSGFEQAAYALTDERAALEAYRPSASALARYSTSQDVTVWPCLDAFAGLPDSASIATTEVGLPGAAFPNRAVIDLAALNDSDIALGHEGVTQSVLEASPDLVYLPTEHFYPTLYNALMSSSTFTDRYTIWSYTQLGAFPSVAVLKSSPYAGILTSCLDVYAKAHGPGVPVSDTGSSAYYLPFPYPITP